MAECTVRRAYSWVCLKKLLLVQLAEIRSGSLLRQSVYSRGSKPNTSPVDVCGCPSIVAPGNHLSRVTCVDITNVNSTKGFAKLLSCLRVQSEADTIYWSRSPTVVSRFYVILLRVWLERRWIHKANCVLDKINLATRYWGSSHRMLSA
jgi:hypothetical protein